MRIIAGYLGGRRLLAKVPDGTRPTSDRVREALGSSLTARGVFEGARVLDLFAGTGALGLEALSRGAERVLAIDREPAALRALTSNVRALAVSDRVTQHKLDLFQAPARVLAALGSLAAQAFSLVFADPPYQELPRIVALSARHGASAARGTPGS